MRDKACNPELACKTYVAILELMAIMTKPNPLSRMRPRRRKRWSLTGGAAAGSTDPTIDSHRYELSTAVF